ncbi:catechol 1,2-dioxygenase-like [Mercenaria mercenaria]|uniref:catechol 1,2-dioxygenase-like n=1 Tax=Mercenaria mercenaria TaxID=6596 RepID=UPI00234EA4B9|nr:catechol 1,2-dioxygenase-like [Mercenaria mercenaria]
MENKLIYIALVLLTSLVNINCAKQRIQSCKATTPDVLGPYYFPNPPRRRQICDRDPAYHDQRHLLVEGRVMDESCQPLSGARIEVWQADHEGHYLFRDNCRGYFFSENGGHYAFLSLHPGTYSTDPEGGLFRPAHIHFRVLKPGYDILVTQMYFAGDPNLGRNDSCTACSSDRSDLIVEPREMCPDKTGKFCFSIAHFDIVLKRGGDVLVVPDIDDSAMELMDIAETGK